MLIVARPYARAARAYVRNSGSIPALAQALAINQAQAQRLVRGRYHFVTPGIARRLLALMDERSVEWIRSVEVTFPIYTGQVPSEIVARLVEEVERACGSNTSAASVVGLHPRRLFAIREQNEGGVGFRVCDKIVTKGIGPWAWLEPPLRRFYFATAPGSVLASSNPLLPERRRRARREPVAA